MRPRRGFAAAIASFPGVWPGPPIARPGDNGLQDITSASFSATVANHRSGTFTRTCLSAGSCSPAGIRRCEQSLLLRIPGRAAPWMYCSPAFLARSCLDAPATTGQDMISTDCSVAVMAHRRGIPPRTQWGRPSVVLPAFAAASRTAYSMWPQRQFAAAVSPAFLVRPGPGRSRTGGGRR